MDKNINNSSLPLSQPSRVNSPLEKSTVNTNLAAPAARMQGSDKYTPTEVSIVQTTTDTRFYAKERDPFQDYCSRQQGLFALASLSQITEHDAAPAPKLLNEKERKGRREGLA